MPTQPKRHRTYCKSCQDFTVHSWKDKENLLCDNCQTKESGYSLNDINPKLIERQKERYNDKKRREFGSIYGAFMMGVGMQTMMELEKTQFQLIEDDAGQIRIDEKKKRIREQLKLKEQENYQDYLDNYKGLNRNDKCSCKSGKKYKQCCLPKFKNY
jgi:uncharacterized protein YecA (UPF0149 family)|tara:strand:- start:83 stop:553 length:471 start_codon:yes stop_codon:yes gene_type:complete